MSEQRVQRTGAMSDAVRTTDATLNAEEGKPMTNQKVLLAEGGSKPRTAQEIRAHRARERKKFENWFRRKWGGISRDVIYHGRDHFEYKESAAQTAWEVWAKFTETQL